MNPLTFYAFAVELEMRATHDREVLRDIEREEHGVCPACEYRVRRLGVDWRDHVRMARYFN